MKKSISFASTFALAGMLALPAVDAAEEGAPAAESFGGLANNVQVATGFYWCHTQQTYRALGDYRTWTYLEGCGIPGWAWVNDNEAEKIFIAAAASAHWIGFNVTSTSGAFDHVRLWKY
jgi:hypothetical protein